MLTQILINLEKIKKETKKTSSNSHKKPDSYKNINSNSLLVNNTKQND
jgi:hypothetical protein